LRSTACAWRVVPKEIAVNRTLLGLCSLWFAGAACAAPAPQVLDIKLQDASTDPSNAHMRIVVDRTTVKPGRVTFRAENQSTTTVHEVLVARNDGSKPLPLDAKH
jgi:hypothetical protein